jgi:hypothetical protein
MVPRRPCLKVNKMNILATYATSYVGALDLALSARSGRSEETQGKTRESDGKTRLSKLFSFGSQKRAA